MVWHLGAPARTGIVAGMKVGMILPGGVDRSGEYRVIPSLLWLIERLARRHEVHVYALYQEPQPSHYQLCGASVHNIGRGFTRVRAIRQVLREHRLAPFDVFHAFWATPAGVIAGALGWMLRRPVLLHIGGGELVALHDIGYGTRCTLRGRAFVHVGLAGATIITGASTAIQQQAAGLGYTADRLPLGVALDHWPVRRVRLRTESRPARLLSVGSINRVKDQRCLLLAAAEMASRGLSFHLNIVGADTLDGEIHRLAEALGLGRCVSFCGFMPQRLLRPLVQASDVLIVSSRHEAGPVVVLEAAITGVPTVGTAVGHVRDWAPDAAVAVPVGNHEALALETLALLGDEDRWQRLAKEAQQRAMTQDADWTAHRVESLYRCAVGRDFSVPID